MYNRNTRAFFLTGLMTCVSFLVTYAQPSLKSTVDRNEILIGEQLKLKVEATAITDEYRINWVSLPDSLQHFEVINRSKIDSTYTDSRLAGLSQTFILTSFDSGKWVLPSFLIGIQRVKDDKSYNFFTDSVPITVAFSASDTTNQLRDIKPIREVEASNPLWYWVGGAILLVLLALIIWLYLRRKKKPGLKVPFKSSLSAYDEAMIELKNLQQYDFAEAVQLKTVHTKLADILKRYLSRKENNSYLNKTTSDVLIGLKESGVNTAMLSNIAAALRSGDAVKFAKYLPEPSETGACITSVKELIESYKPDHSRKQV